MFAMRHGILDRSVQKSLLPITMNGKRSKSKSGMIKLGMYIVIQISDFGIKSL